MKHVSKYGFLVSNTPPRLPNKEDYETEVYPWKDALIDTIPEKLNWLVLREDEIIEKRDSELARINAWVLKEDVDYWSEYFWTMMAESCTYELNRIYKWMHYWLKLYEIASDKKVIEVEDKELGVSPEQVEMAKQFPIENLLGGDIKHLGSRLMACCPFHEENTPSFTIFTNDNHFHCFGCGAHGDAIDFVMKQKKLNLIEAVKEINRV